MDQLSPESLTLNEPSQAATLPPTVAGEIASVAGGSAAPLGAPVETVRRLTYIDCLRAIAAIWVLCGHALSMEYPTPASVPDYLIWTSIVTANIFQPVVAFICISGFSLFLPIAKNHGQMRSSIIQYLLARAKRILPPYYAALIVGTYVARHYQPWPHHLFLQEALDHVLLIQDWTGLVTMIVPPMWSIAVEWHIYFILPLIAYLFLRYGLIRVVIGVAVAAAVADAFLPNESMHYSFYILFSIGAASALISYSDIPAYCKYRVYPWRWIAIGILILWALGVNVVDSTLEFGLGICATLIASAQSAKPLLDSKALAFIGEFSYSIYLLHWTVLLWLYYHFHLQHSAVFVPLAIVSSLALSLVFHLVFERPFMTKRRNMPIFGTDKQPSLA